jgi:predicted nucleotidyltransferase
MTNAPSTGAKVAKCQRVRLDPFGLGDSRAEWSDCPRRQDVVQRYGASNLRVFGSVVLNQEHPNSDLDLLIDLLASQSLLALVGIAQELEQLLGCPVDVAEPDSLHPLIRSEVLKQAVRLS